MTLELLHIMVNIIKKKTIKYYQNVLNQRTGKLADGKWVEKYLWKDLTTLLAVYHHDRSDYLKYRFEYADGRMPVAMTDNNGKKFYLHYDQVGSLRAISDSNQNIVKEITYDTYGNILSDTNSSLSVPFGFAGGLYDADTKLTRFGYRDYDAYTGKWTAKDPIGFGGGDSNLYGYVLGNPVGFVDPMGLDIQEKWDDFWDVGPFDSWTAGITDRREAEDKSRSVGLPGPHNGKQDAYRHCLWSCLMASDIGTEQAKSIGDNHESAGTRNGQPNSESNMDQHNNSEGRTCAVNRPSFDRSSCPSKCKKALNNGDLQTSL